MTDTYVFEHGVVLLCQCMPPCHAPFRDETGEWSMIGCLLPKGHDAGDDILGGGHSLDGPPGGFAYRDPPTAVGMRIVLRRAQPGADIFRGTCLRCLREYAMSVTSFSAETAAVVASDSEERP